MMSSLRRLHHGLRATEHANMLAESISPILMSSSSALTTVMSSIRECGLLKLALSPFRLVQFPANCSKRSDPSAKCRGSFIELV